jgi:outer membrane protein TolC
MQRAIAVLVVFSMAVFVAPAGAEPETAGEGSVATSGESTEVPIPSLAEQLRLQWSLIDLRPAPESKGYVETRDDTLEHLSLREAVHAAIENNPAIASERLRPAFARADVDRANGAFDPTFEATADYDRRVEPTSSALAGAQILREEETVFGASLKKLLRTGTTFTVAGRSDELDSNSNFLGLRPQYKPTVDVTLNQPLLKDFGVDLTILLVRSAEATSSAAYYEYQSQAASLVRRVVEDYWSIVRAKEDLRAEQDGLALARELVKENQARVRAGSLPPVAVKEAEADAASRDERVIGAENTVSVAKDRLRLLVQKNPEGAFLPRPIEPSDTPEIRDVEPNEEEILANAIAGRPELQRARYENENRKILARVKRNNLLPGLDLEGRYGLNGLSGHAEPQFDFTTGETRFTRFKGDYGEAWQRLKSNDFNSYGAGIRLSVPLGNDTAKAEYTQSEIEVRRGELDYRALLADVTLEVRRAISDVRTNSKRITASRLARELAQENLAQQKKRYDVGLSTTKDLLDFQSRVTAARAAETQALIDYNVSLAALRQAEGTLLTQFDVVLDALPPSPTPVWARF